MGGCIGTYILVYSWIESLAKALTVSESVYQRSSECVRVFPRISFSVMVAGGVGDSMRQMV